MEDPPVTTVSWNHIPESLNIEDPESENGRIFRRAIEIVTSRSGRDIYWGRMLEDPDKVILLMIFESLDARIKARDSDWRQDSFRELMSISIDHPTIWHIEFDQDIRKALESPVTTFAQALFDPSEESAALRAGFDDHYQRYQANLSPGPGGPLAGLFAGWTLEENMPYTGISDGKAYKGKAFVMASGWNSADEMMKYHTSEDALRWSASALSAVGGWTLQNIKFNCTKGGTGSA